MNSEWEFTSATEVMFRKKCLSLKLKFAWLFQVSVLYILGNYIFLDPFSLSLSLCLWLSINFKSLNNNLIAAFTACFQVTLSSEENL